MNVMLVLIIGILTSGIIGIATGSFGVFDWFGAMGTGITGMGELIIITLLAGGMLETIRYNGGIDFIIKKLTRHVNSKRGAELSIAALVSIADLLQRILQRNSISTGEKQPVFWIHSPV